MTSTIVPCALLTLLATGCVVEDDLDATAAAVVTPGHELVVVETAVDTAATKQVVASCPAGKVPLGAGWADLDATGAILDGVATHSAPSAGSWIVNARHATAWEPAWKLRVTLICAAPPPRYRVVTVESAVDASPTKQLQPTCPKGSKSTGGGFAVLDATGAILDGEATYFQPSWDGGSWLINARNNAAFAPTWKLRASIVCASTGGLPGYQPITATSSLDASPSKQVEVACPGVVTGAGWGVLDATGVILDGAALHATAGWEGTTWLTNAQGAGTWQLQVRALCVD